MSLLDRGPHRLVVTPKVITEDQYGQTVTDGEPVVVRCSMQPMTSEELTESGIQAETAYRVIARAWPGGPYSSVFVLQGPLDTTGRTFDQQGEGRRYGMSERTQHVDVVITARGTEVK